MTLRALLLPALSVVFLLPACATRQDNDISAAIEDFIAVAGLEPLDKVRTRGDYSYDYLSDRFIIIETRDGEYLARFQRLCRELNELPVQPDIRYDDSMLRSRFDTIRGCHIHSLYAIERGQADELRNIGRVPGDRLK
jgi:hypothetical protein